MTRVSRGVTTHARHKKVIKRAKDITVEEKMFQSSSPSCRKSSAISYRDRRKRKSDFRCL